jgi:DNA-binding MarR family transcriptional regulator
MNSDSLEALELELAILYRRITSITAHRKIGNLDRSAYLLLHHMSAHGAIGVKALAFEFGLDISTVSRQAAALEHKGYIKKTQDPLDGRASSLQITELGKRELMECKNERLNKVAEVMEDWSEDEQKMFGLLLKKFNRSVIKQQLPEQE